MSLTDKLSLPSENPENFLYIAHGIMDWDGKGPYRECVEDKLANIKKQTNFYRASIVGDLSKEKSYKMLGLSEPITQHHTFGNIGFLLRPTQDQLIKISWECDLSSPNSPEELRKFVETYEGRRLPIEKLMHLKSQHASSNVCYNEIIINGSENTAVEGIFYKDITGYENSQAKELKGMLNEDIPMIELPVSLPCETNYSRDSTFPPCLQNSRYVKEKQNIFYKKTG